MDYIALQAPLSMGFSRQEYWSGLSCCPPGDLPDPGIEPSSPALQVDSLLSEPPGMSSLKHSWKIISNQHGDGDFIEWCTERGISKSWGWIRMKGSSRGLGQKGSENELKPCCSGDYQQGRWACLLLLKKKKKVGIINDGKEIKERQEQEVMESLLDGSQETGLS